LSAVTTSAAFSSGVPAKITTGTRAASRSMKGEGTIPSPIKMPSALPVNDSSRGKPGSLAPCKKVISSDH